MKKSKRILSLLLSIALILTSIMLTPIKKAMALESMNRYYGNNRYDTAVAICNAGWDKSDNVVLAIGGDFPDALSATPLASKLNAPILLTEGVTLSSDLAAAITRLQARNVFLIGGDDVISLAIENSLKSMNLRTTRLYGDNRYLTCLQVANYIAQNFGVGSEAAVATGEDFPDALSIAAIAAKRGMPILLSEKNSLPAEIKAYISQYKITKTYIIGGSDVVSNNVMSQLPGAERISGDNRYDTNAAILNRFAGDLDFSTVYLATGEDFPDALSGSALAAKTGSPVVLTYRIPELSTSNSIEARCSSIKQLRIFGGDDVVPNPAVSLLIPAVNTVGNTSANISYAGHAAKQGNWIYYFNPYDDGYGLYKIRTDNAAKQKLSNRPVAYINVVGEWIYFVDLNNLSEVCKVKVDGTGEMVISWEKTKFLNVVGDWMYYLNGSDNWTLYRMKTDCTQKTKLSSVSINNFAVYGDWIYYTTSDYAFHKVKTDGTGTIDLGNFNAIYLNVVDDWIYYMDRSNGYICKVKTDGTGKTIINREASEYLNIDNGWIYYMNDNDNYTLYKIRIDGTGRTKLNTVGTMIENIAGDWIYYYEIDSSGNFTEYCRMKTNGTGREIIQ